MPAAQAAHSGARPSLARPAPAAASARVRMGRIVGAWRRAATAHTRPHARSRAHTTICTHIHTNAHSHNAHSHNTQMLAFAHSYKQEYTHTQISHKQHSHTNIFAQRHTQQNTYTHRKLLMHKYTRNVYSYTQKYKATYKYKATAHTGTSIHSPMHTHLHTQISHIHTTHAHICTQHTHTNYTQIHTHIQHMCTHTCTVLHTLTQANSHK